jgi:hypothetical protein
MGQLDPRPVRLGYVELRITKSYRPWSLNRWSKFWGASYSSKMEPAYPSPLFQSDLG